MERGEKSLEEWRAEERSITLTNSQWVALTTYLVKSANYRNEEIKYYEKLAERKGSNGIPEHKDASHCAEYWKNINAELKIIRKKIDGM